MAVGSGHLAGLALTQWRRIAIAVVLTVLSTAIALIMPWGIRGLVDSTFTTGGRSRLEQLAIVLLVLLLVQGVVNFSSRYLITWTGERIVADLRRRAYAHLHTLPVRFFDDRNVGDLLSRLTTDAGLVRAAVKLSSSAIRSAGTSDTVASTPTTKKWWLPRAQQMPTDSFECFRRAMTR